MRGHTTLARFAAPAAFLLAATFAVLIGRAALTDEEGATAPPAATTTVPTTTSSRDTGTGKTTTAPADAQYYKIQAGDTLAVVADQYNTTVEQLLVLNPDVDPVALNIGQRIRVK